MRAVRVVVNGHVQGVGYRWFTRDAARAAGIAGWVRNRHNGSVEAVLQGADDSVEAVLAAMQAGPDRSRVEDLSISDAAADPAVTAFELRPTV